MIAQGQSSSQKKERKLQANIADEHLCQNIQQNIGKSNIAMH